MMEKSERLKEMVLEEFKIDIGKDRYIEWINYLMGL